MDVTTLAAAEVEELHAFFGQWYASPSTLDLRRVSAVLAAEFELLAPNGQVLSRDELLDGLIVERGAFPDLLISVESIIVSPTRGDEVHTRYTEIHRERERVERRLCCALLRRCANTPNGVQWIAIGERHDGPRSRG
jgi:hypothetical protein